VKVGHRQAPIPKALLTLAGLFFGRKYDYLKGI